MIKHLNHIGRVSLHEGWKLISKIMILLNFLFSFSWFMENNAFIVILIFRPLGLIFKLYFKGVRILKPILVTEKRIKIIFLKVESFFTNWTIGSLNSNARVDFCREWNDVCYRMSISQLDSFWIRVTFHQKWHNLLKHPCERFGAWSPLINDNRR